MTIISLISVLGFKCHLDNWWSTITINTIGIGSLGCMHCAYFPSSLCIPRPSSVSGKDGNEGQKQSWSGGSCCRISLRSPMRTKSPLDKTSEDSYRTWTCTEPLPGGWWRVRRSRQMPAGIGWQGCAFAWRRGDGTISGTFFGRCGAHVEKATVIL